MVDFIEYVVSELKSKRLGKAGALELIRQFFERRTNDAKLHPLLHRNVSTLTQQRYRTRLGGDEFFLRDHRVRMPDGVVAAVLPGVAYLEIARAAVADAVPDLAASSMIAFEDVLWLSPVVVSGERDILIDVDAEEDFLEFRVFSEDDAGHRHDHASGRIRFYDAVDAEPLDVGALREAMGREHWDAASVYRTYAQIGIEYGPAHQGIVRLDSGEGQVLAEIALPDALAGEDNTAYVLHPALVDGALQAAIGLGERDARPTEPLLPFALDSLCIVGDCTERLHAFVRRADAADADAAQLTLDVDLCDDDGNICVQLRGLCARRFDRKGIVAQPLDATDAETLVAVAAWSDDRPRHTAAARECAHVHVLLCGLGDADPSSIAFLLPDSSVESIDPSGEHPASRYEAFALKVFERLQDVLRRQPEAGTFLQCVVPDTTEGLLLTGLDGMLRTAAQENPSLATQLVIVAPDVDARRVAADLAYAAANSHLSPLRLSAQGWRSRDWTVLPPESEAASAQPYREDGVYIITGGRGGLGSLVARDILAHARHAHVVLTGRSPLDDGIQARLEASGFLHPTAHSPRGGGPGFASRLHYRRLDLESSEDCRQAIEEIRNVIGTIRGVFHCAGTRDDNVILKKTAQEAAAVLAPKVRGTWHLDEATRDLDLDFFALFSSGVSVFGNAGQADYAAANGFLDAFAAYREALAALGERRGRTISIDWPLWEAGGMQLDAEGQQWLRVRTGMTPMRSDSGLAVLRRALVGRDVQWLAVEGEGRRLRRLFDGPPPRHPNAQACALGTPPRHPNAQACALGTPPPAPVRKASAPAPEAKGNPIPAATGGDLLAECREFLRREFAPVLKIAAAQIDIQEALENYGINSILAMNLTSQLEKHLGPLPKTLFFEYQTIAALSEHLVQAHAAELRALVSVDTAPAAVLPKARRERKPAELRQQIKPPMRGKATASASRMRRAHPGLPARCEPVAVVGLSGRYPESETLQDFWRNLRDGNDCIVEVPPERWRWQDYYTSDRDTRGHYSKWGGFIRGADEFDPQFFNISPREAPYIDPQERLFLQHAWMAIEDAGYSRKSLRVPRTNGLAAQVGVYAGVMYGEYNRSGSLASIANRVSYVLNLHGPSLTLDTMCSSSLTAIHLACQDLRSGRTDLAIAGGVNLSLHPGKYSMLSAGQFISTAGHCQSFGEGGDGYIPGEGVGVVVLKRLSEAERDGDAIHAVIRGSALNHGGKTNGYTVPNPQAQAAVIAAALQEAGVDARQVSYIEAHGTGTKLGDPIEVAAISQAFR
ncbi:MAG TPA: beta-ketoacyl synthase N-terminal-like domain-containing protein, partial [Vicinamibacterales bacterium]